MESRGESVRARVFGVSIGVGKDEVEKEGGFKLGFQAPEGNVS